MMLRVSSSLFIFLLAFLSFSFGASADITTSEKRLFFYIALVDSGTDAAKSFVRAANTWENETKLQYHFREGQDIFIEKYVHTPQDFIRVWHEIDAKSQQEKNNVILGAIFTHSSTPLAFWNKQGLEFPQSSRDHMMVLSKQAIDDLPRLSWDKKGKLILFGCHSGAPQLAYPSWSPAGEFARKQYVTTYGENGFAVFSESPVYYKRIDTNEKPSNRIYLGYYIEGWNGLLTIIPTSIFYPFIYKTRLSEIKFNPPDK